MTHCPKCSSNEVEFIEYLGIKCLVCKRCGYDERDEYALDQGSRPSAKQKATHSPYKTGGARRTQK